MDRACELTCPFRLRSIGIALAKGFWRDLCVDAISANVAGIGQDC